MVLGKPRDAGNEAGAIAIMFAILLIAIFLMVALVVDLGMARAQKRDNQTVADLAALAAGPKLPDKPIEACNDAWSYVKTNLSDLPAGASMPCSSIPVPCNPALPAVYTATGTGIYTITIRYPYVFPAGDSRTNDGAPCERMAVTIETLRNTFFARVAGITQQSVGSFAVVRGFSKVTQGVPIALLLLDPIGCKALVNSGQGRALVYASGTYNGVITVDSNGTKSTQPNTCTSGSTAFTIDVSGTSNAVIKACGNVFDGDLNRCDVGGVINLFALAGGSCVLPACDPADVPTRLFPQPTRESVRATRGPVDYEFNCRNSYPNFPYREDPVSSSPQHISIPGYPAINIPIPKCDPDLVANPNATPPNTHWIDTLVADVGSGCTAPNCIGPKKVPFGYRTWSTDPAIALQTSRPCSPTTPVVAPPGNWYVDCTSLAPTALVTFLGGNVVVEGQDGKDAVDLKSGTGGLVVNSTNLNANLPNACLRAVCPGDSSDKAAFFYVRHGDLAQGSQASVLLRNTMVFLENGAINFGAGGTSLTWSGPFEGPFNKLSLWSESTMLHSMGGQSNLSLDGVFFTPNALPFSFTGAAGQFQTKAQFISWDMEVKGQGDLIMQPDPARNVLFPVQNFFLIR